MGRVLPRLPASTSTPANAPSSGSSATSGRRSAPRSSATSAASAVCSPFASHRYRSPVLVSSTDGVGTKALIAEAAGRFDTIGIDLVAMCVDDIVCQGAEPLFFLDYIAVGKLDPDHIDALVAGVAEGCRNAGCALIGGEMAEHPGAMEPGEFDLVGFAVGVAERDQMITGEQVTRGRRADRPAVARPALERLLARPPGAARAGRSTPRRARVRGRASQPRRRAARAVGDLRPGGRSPCCGSSTCTPSPTSPAAGCPATSPGSCRAASTPSSTGRRGRRRGSSPRSSGSARSTSAEMARVFNLGIGMVARAPGARRLPRHRPPAQLRPPGPRDRPHRTRRPSACGSNPECAVAMGARAPISPAGSDRRRRAGPRRGGRRPPPSSIPCSSASRNTSRSVSAMPATRRQARSRS